LTFFPSIFFCIHSCFSILNDVDSRLGLRLIQKVVGIEQDVLQFGGYKLLESDGPPGEEKDGRFDD
jgi:hypothetical protein